MNIEINVKQNTIKNNNKQKWECGTRKREILGMAKTKTDIYLIHDI